MHFNKEEIETVFRKHLIDDWKIPEDAIQVVKAVVKNVKNEWVPQVEVAVKTNDTKGGGPYRSPGKTSPP